MDYQDILYEERDGAAWITINRPDKIQRLSRRRPARS